MLLFFFTTLFRSLARVLRGRGHAFGIDASQLSPYVTTVVEVEVNDSGRRYSRVDIAPEEA
jgi:hypothetical protein